MFLTLSDLGWSSHFAAQHAAYPSCTPFRITSVHRDRLIGLNPYGEVPLLTLDQSTGSYAVGDWVLHRSTTNACATCSTGADLLHRRAAGTGAATQLIAANVDVLFIVSSCNADFNLPRLERYLALAHQAGCYPVVVLTKADKSEDPDSFSGQVQSLDPFLTVLAINALDPAEVEKVLSWCSKSQTGALVGSSGVGKTTLANSMTGQDLTTSGIREDDARGRHTTTARRTAPDAQRRLVDRYTRNARVAPAGRSGRDRRSFLGPCRVEPGLPFCGLPAQLRARMCRAKGDQSRHA